VKTFYALLANTLIASLTNTFVWFAVTFWLYLQTRSVIAISVMAGIYLATVSVSGFYLGSLVDRFEKRRMLLLSSTCSLLLFTLAALLYRATPRSTFTDPTSVVLWFFIVLNLFGAIIGNLRSIALTTLVTILVPEERRDRANGMVGTANGIAFFLTSIFSGLAIGYLGIGWTMVIAIGLTTLVLAHLWTVQVTERRVAPADGQPHRIDIPGTIRVIGLVPGLFGLIFFTTFNNLLGGVFMSLMDAYGLSLVSVQTWGLLWGGISLGFIVGGLAIARYGLGNNPLRTLFLTNVALWTICIFFTIQPWIELLAVGMFFYLCLAPVVEASEQTILQKVVPFERQGRVFGFAQSLEQAASPLTAFVVGPLAQLVFIPLMTTGAGAGLIGSWYGTGTDRGIALLFSLAGIVGMVMTLLAMRTRAFRTLSERYRHDGPPDASGDAAVATRGTPPARQPVAD